MNSQATDAGLSERFTLEQANRMLPLVRAIVKDLRSQQTLVDELTNRLNRLGRNLKKSSVSTDPVFTEEINEFRRELEIEQSKLESYRHELTRLGVLPRHPIGHCDFPSSVDGQDVDLCWTPEDQEILFWHFPGDELDQRKPLVAEAGAGFDDHSADHSWNDAKD